MSSKSEPKYRNEAWLRQKYLSERKTIRQIAEECNVCKTTIRNWIHKFDIETRSLLENRRPEDSPLRDREWLNREYRDKGRSSGDIADELNVSSQTVLRWLERKNIKKRDGGGPAKHPLLEDSSWLYTQYHEKERKVGDIAEELGVSSPTISRRLSEHGIEKYDGQIPLDSPLRDGDWLREEYVEKRRTSGEIAEECDVSKPTVYRWLRKAEIDIRERGHLSGEEHPNWRGGHRRYGRGWNPAKRSFVRNRDNHTCQHPGCEITSKKHKQIYSGRELHVHHLLKARDVDDPEIRNDPKNLVTLCIKHHKRYEKISEAGIRPQFDFMKECDGGD